MNKCADDKLDEFQRVIISVILAKIIILFCINWQRSYNLLICTTDHSSRLR